MGAGYSRWRVVSVALVLALAGDLSASDHDDAFTLRGFGTVGVVYSDESHADFTGSLLRPSGAGHSRSISAAPDSRLGVQLDLRANERWSAVVQGVSEQRDDGSYRPTLEWANVRFEPVPDLAVRAGRILLPTFLVGETRKVGYANPWLRPPLELYVLSPVTSSDGVDASVRRRLGEWTHTFQASYGSADARAPGGVSVDVRALRGFFYTAEAGPWTVRGGYVRGVLGFKDLDPFFDAFRAFGPSGDMIADRYRVDGKAASIASVGGAYEPGDWFVMAEFAHTDTRSIFAEHRAGYVSAGRRIGRFTPYVTVSKLHRRTETESPGLDITGLPPEAVMVAAMLNAMLNEGLGASATQKTVSLGVRWDPRPGIAIKLQADHVDVGSGALGMFNNIQPGYTRGGRVNLIGLGVDFVF